MSGEIPEKGESPNTTKHAQHSPNRYSIGDGVLLRERVFEEDWIAVPNDEYGSQNTPTSGHLGCALLPGTRELDPLSWVDLAPG